MPQDLEVEKRRFAEFENDMKQRCKELETELATLRSSSAATSPSTSSMSVGTDTRPSDTEDPATPRKDSRQATLKRSSALYDDEDYTIDDVIEELNNIVNSAESDMNTENSSNDTASLRDHLVTSGRIPHPPRRAESVPASAAVRLGEDLEGETSDYPAVQSDARTGDQDGVLSPDGRKKLSRTYFGQNSVDERLFQSATGWITIAVTRRSCTKPWNERRRRVVALRPRTRWTFRMKRTAVLTWSKRRFNPIS